MLENVSAFSGFAVDDLAAARGFYEMLGLDVVQTPMGLELHFEERNPVYIYEKPDFEPATYTVLNFEVDDIDIVVDELVARGLKMEQYGDMHISQDAKGIARGKAAGMGPDIAWFKDPAGNILSIICS